MSEEANPDVGSKNVKPVVYIFYLVCAGLLCADFFHYKHPHFDFEGWWGFYGLYAFLGSVALVMVSKAMRVVLMRGEDYYDA